MWRNKKAPIDVEALYSKVRIEDLKSRLDSIPLIQEQQTEIINHLNKLSEQAKRSRQV